LTRAHSLPHAAKTLLAPGVGFAFPHIVVGTQGVVNCYVAVVVKLAVQYNLLSIGDHIFLARSKQSDTVPALHRTIIMGAALGIPSVARSRRLNNFNILLFLLCDLVHA
jgi:hypothetical protein